MVVAIIITAIVLIYFRKRISDSYKLSELNMDSNSERQINSLHPAIKSIAIEFLTEAKKQGFNLMVTSGLRTYKQQEDLYNQGRTTPGNVVTNARPGYSYHNFGLAFDVAGLKDGKLDYNIDWTKLGAIGKKVGLSWGGDWTSFKDKPHFEHKANMTLAQLRTAYESGKVEGNYVILTA